MKATKYQSTCDAQMLDSLQVISLALRKDAPFAITSHSINMAVLFKEK